MTSYRYRVFGLSVRSELMLPDLAPVSDASVVDVDIVMGDAPRRDPSATVDLTRTPTGALLTIVDVARFHVEGGRVITVTSDPAASDRNVRLYLLGSAFGTILHQRGLLPLHANAIVFGDTAAAFMGHSGAGKSTLANWFRDHGRPILGDDVCVVRPAADGTVLAEPGLPRVRLWRDALVASGRDATDFPASFDDMDKYDVSAADAQPPAAMPLTAIYVLERAADGVAEAGPIRQLHGMAATHALVANTYRGGYLSVLGGIERHLGQCVALAQRVPVFALRRRWGLERMAEEAALIVEHVTAHGLAR